MAAPSEHAAAAVHAPAREALPTRLFGYEARHKLLAFASLILLLIFFSFASPAFAQMENILGILQATAVNGVLAVASTFVIITAGIDLSVGTLMTFCAVMCGVFLTYWHLPMWTGVLAAIGAGALSGATSGTLVAKLKLPPFIATLGMMWLLKGLSLIVSGVKPIYFNDTENFYMISQASLIGAVLPSVPIPNGVLILFVIAVAASFALNRTLLGRYTYVLGGNEEAARLSGVDVDAWKIAIYCLGGSIVRRRRPHYRVASQFRPARARPGLRARSDRRGRHRRHVLERRNGIDPRHHHRRVHHERADQRPAHSFGRAGMADGRDGRHHHPRRLHGHPAAQARLRRRGVIFKGG